MKEFQTGIGAGLAAIAMSLAYPEYAPIFQALPFPYAINLYSSPLAFFAVTSKLGVTTYQQFMVVRGLDRMVPKETRVALGQNIVTSVIGIVQNEQSYIMGVNMMESVYAIAENEYANVLER